MINYLKCLTCIHELHRLQVNGLMEDPEYELVQDSMDKTWLLLSPDENKSLQEISEKLYSVGSTHEIYLNLLKEIEQLKL